MAKNEHKNNDIVQPFTVFIDFMFCALSGRLLGSLCNSLVFLLIVLIAFAIPGVF